MTFGERLKAARKAKQLSQEQLGSGLGPDGSNVTKQTVSNWENGRFVPSIEQIPTLCERLGCSSDWLLSGKSTTIALSPEVAQVAALADQLPPEARAKLLPFWKELVEAFMPKAGQNPSNNGAANPTSHKRSNGA